nr:phosphoadenylyl-sulfate reductase [Rubeoparvulum massiliense]
MSEVMFDQLIEKGVEEFLAEEVIQWGLEHFKDGLVCANSLGAEDVVILHMLAQLEATIPIFFLDTGLHFQETHVLKKAWEERLGRSLITLSSTLSLEEQALQYGERLWEHDPNLCCTLRKVIPLRNYLADQKAWITGIRREQAPTRRHAKKIEWDANFQLVKLNPLADWSTTQLWNYIKEHDLPYHQLHDQGYPSIGCSFCTRPVKAGEDLRAGRWSGYEKTECGLHGHG